MNACMYGGGGGGEYVLEKHKNLTRLFLFYFILFY